MSMDADKTAGSSMLPTMIKIEGDLSSSSDSEDEGQLPDACTPDKISQVSTDDTTSLLIPADEQAALPDFSLMPVPSCQSFTLSDAVSAVSGEEIIQRREALRLFSSQKSMASLALKGSVTQLPAVIVSHELTPYSSTLSSLYPVCRICHCPADSQHVLISPCRCSGSLKYIHGTCLRKWLEVLERKHRHTGPAFCELCYYIYRKRKFLKRSNFRWPRVAVRDKILHSVFVVAFLLMIGCAIATVLCFTADKDKLTEKSRKKVEVGEDGQLEDHEVITIACGVTFFVSFFVAMSVELKAKHAIHYIFKRFIRYNTIWMIENYKRSNDHRATSCK